VRLGNNEIDALGAQACIGKIQILEPAYECVLAEFVVAPRIYHGLRVTMARPASVPTGYGVTVTVTAETYAW
jgi:hypothetical protein